MNFLRKYLTEIVLIAGILLVFGVTAWFNPAYRDNFSYNLTTLILHPAALLGIFSLGAAVVIISGGIDLSSGAVIAFSAATVSLLLVMFGEILRPDAAVIGWDLPWWAIAISVLIAVFMGVLIGSIHTWLITEIRLPPFVATLASLVGLRSLAKIMNKAITTELGNQSIKVNIQSPRFYEIGDNWIVAMAIFAGLALFVHVVLNHTVPGRHLYAMGGNENAAVVSGIRTKRLKWFAYSFAGVTSAIAGVLFAAQIQQSDPESQGVARELFAIAAAVIGGCSLSGGAGRVSGVVLGAIFLRVVIDAVAKLIPSGSDDFEGLIVGFLVAIAVAFNQLAATEGGWRRQFFPGLLGAVSLVTVSLLAGSVVAFGMRLSGNENAWTRGAAATLLVGLTLLVVASVGWIGARRNRGSSQ